MGKNRGGGGSTKKKKKRASGEAGIAGRSGRSDRAPPLARGDDDGGKEESNMLHFEDPYEDEVEEMDEVADGNDQQQTIMDDEEDGSAAPPSVRTFRPGIDTLNDGETLDYDSNAYQMYHALRPEWPCLSFDVHTDSLGVNRKRFPHTVYAVAGTQADRRENNRVICMKMSDLHRTKHDDDDEDDAGSDDENDLDDDPILEHRSFSHEGGVNRLRLMPQKTSIVATWADTGRVHVFDASDHLASLDKASSKPLDPNLPPAFSFDGHADEGFALDWSPTVEGRLLSGDCSKFVYAWDPAPGGTWVVNKMPYTGHASSVEDVQWSPSEENVFASCSVDRTIKIWDSRKRDAAALSVHAHSDDVNVISWNRTVNYLLVSGCDDGSFAIWDLRTFRSGGDVKPAALFKWHRGPITSVQWHPSDGSVVAVAGADDQVTVWDLSLEHDDNVVDLEGVPPQLLFVHQGQTAVKEVHWHRQIPGAILTTAQSGFNVFKPDNL